MEEQKDGQGDSYIHPYNYACRGNNTSVTPPILSQ